MHASLPPTTTMPPMLSSQMTLKRINREIADVAKEDLGSITLVPTTDNLFVWKGSIPGPQGSPYEGGVFGVDVVLGNDYPFSAPKVTFATRIYHMNISDRGNVCIDILKNNWSPALSLFKVMLSLSSLLTDPNPHDPLVPNIATEFVRNRAQHDKTARQWTELYAKPKPPPPPTPAPAPHNASSSSSSTAAARASSNGITATTTKSSKGKGKALSPSPASRNRSSRTTSRAPTQTPVHIGTEPITIDDSDEDDSSRVGGSSTNGIGKGKGKKRKRELGADEVVDLTDEDAGAGGGGRKSKRRSDEGVGVSMGAGAMGDVIVIDD